MTLDKVVQSIREEGRRAADARLTEARKEADAILEDARQQASKLKEKRHQELANAKDAIALRDVAAAELEARKSRLNAEKEVLAKVRESVLERLSNLPDAKRIEHVQALVANSTIQGGHVLVAERDVDGAKQAGLNVEGTVDALGGVVVVSPDGATREDLTYETLVDEVWASSLNEVASTLFGKK